MELTYSYRMFLKSKILKFYLVILNYADLTENLYLNIWIRRLLRILFLGIPLRSEGPGSGSCRLRHAYKCEQYMFSIELDLILLRISFSIVISFSSWCLYALYSFLFLFTDPLFAFVLHHLFLPVLGILIRIRRIRMFLGLPDPLIRGTDPDPSLFS
jgi:hypothetical protein